MNEITGKIERIEVNGKIKYSGDVGPRGPAGPQGTKGNDGISPTISVSKSGKTTTIEITDENGTKIAKIEDGLDGYDDTEIKTEIEAKVSKVVGKDLSTNDYDDTEKQNNTANTLARHTHSNKSILDNTTASYTSEEKSKLAGLNNYTLPVASSTTLGGVKAGTNVTIADDGTISTSGAGEISNAENTNIQVLKIWVGTQTQYDAITTKEDNTEYNIIEE